VPAANVTLVSGNKVLLQNVALTAGTYYLEIETGLIEDLRGNAMLLQVLKNQWEVTVQDGYGSHPAPSVVMSNPASGTTANVSSSEYEGKVQFFFSDTVVIGTGSVSVRRCPSVGDCSGGGLVESFPAGSLSIVDGSVLVVTLSSVVADEARYQITVPAGIVANSDGQTSQQLTGPADFTFDIEKTASSFAVDKHVLFVDGASSNADGLAFNMLLSATTSPGTYKVCYCSGQLDQSLAVFGDGDTTYQLTEDLKCNDAVVTLSGSNSQLLGMPLADHECQAKCASGCVGPHCYCDGYLEAKRSAPGALCLPKHLCADACDLEAGCTGINVHDDLPVCILATACSSTETVEDMQYFEKKTGTACTHFSDFTETAGTLAVTNRVDVAVDYVTTPQQDASVELTGTSLLNGASQMLSSDRIMVIDCGGTCGVSGPSSGLDLPENAAKVETWNKFWPKTYFQDDPSDYVDRTRVVNPVEPASALGYYGDEGGSHFTGKYCAGNNIDIKQDGLQIPVEGVSRPVKEYGCWSKCSQESCIGDHCFCDGYFSGYDSPTSNAICADMETCKYICDNIEGCASIDMHNELPRCFLNQPSCTFLREALATDPLYSLLVKRTQINDGANDRRLGDAADDSGMMTPLPALDLGFSWGAMLRFAPIRFTSGGTFKLCFCDSALLPSGRTCRSVEDYAVEVGTVHASGVSCLIGKPELQRASCASQFHGGLRCYRDRDAPDPQPPVLAPLSAGGAESGEYMEALQTYCMYQPEEVGCQMVSGFQSAE